VTPTSKNSCGTHELALQAGVSVACAVSQHRDTRYDIHE